MEALVIAMSLLTVWPYIQPLCGRLSNLCIVLKVLNLGFWACPPSLLRLLLLGAPQLNTYDELYKVDMARFGSVTYQPQPSF